MRPSPPSKPEPADCSTARLSRRGQVGIWPLGLVALVLLGLLSWLFLPLALLAAAAFRWAFGPPKS